MKRYLRVVAVAALFDFSLTYATVAADMPVKGSDCAPRGTTSPAIGPGQYLGVNFGGSWSNGTTNIAGAAWDPGATAFVGGLGARLPIGGAKTCCLGSTETLMGRSLIGRPLCCRLR